MRPRPAPSLEAGQAVPLFATRIGGAVQFNPQQYLVSADGQRFLMSVVTAESVPMTVVLDWKPK